MVKVEYDEKKKEWITLPKGTRGRGLMLDGFLKKKLDNIKILQEKNWDCVIQIVGAEGSGKSTLSFVIGQYLSNMGLTLNNICAGAQDAIEKLKSLPDGSVLIIDEAELLFSSKEAMKKEQRHLINILMVIRQKRMVLILVSPDFFSLSKYICVHRSRFVLRTYTDNNLVRGRFAYWGQKKKAMLYEKGKKNFGSYNQPKADFFGRYTDYKLPFHDEYVKTKMKSLQEAFDGKKEETKELNPKEMIMKNLQNYLSNPELQKRLPREELAKVFGVSRASIVRYITEFRANSGSQDQHIVDTTKEIEQPMPLTR